MSLGITGMIIPQPMTSMSRVMKINPIAALRVEAINANYANISHELREYFTRITRITRIKKGGSRKFTSRLKQKLASSAFLGYWCSLSCIQLKLPGKHQQRRQRRQYA